MTPFVGPPEPMSPISLIRQAEDEDRARSLGAGWTVGPTAASLFDAWATNDAIARGGVEANPLMGPFAGGPGIYAIKGAQGILTGLIARKLAHDGHGTAARIVSGLGIAIPLAAGTHNALGGR